MNVTRHEVLPLSCEEDLVRARQRVRESAKEHRFTITDQTKLVTATSELARNALVYGGGGTIELEVLSEGELRLGLRVSVVDRGPGIEDMQLAMRDGYTTGRGLGLGLSGSKRLVHEFAIESRVGEGTTVKITMWK